MTLPNFDAVRKHIIMDRFPQILDLEKSHGSWLVDAATGDTYLDCYTGISSLPIGYNHPRMMDAEFLGQLGRAAVNKPALSDTFTPEYGEFVTRFANAAMKEHFKYLFLIDGGALAVENAFKAAFDWRTRKNVASGNATVADTIISLKQAFHGRTGYTLSVTDSFDQRKTQWFPKFDWWPRITNPKIQFPLTDDEHARLDALEAHAFAEIDLAFQRYGHRIAGLIIEPIQGEGGDNHFRSSFLAGLRAKADEYGFLLIFDEVQTGGGATGTFWCWEQLNVVPDIVTFGKKTQTCGLVAGPRMDEVDSHVFVRSSRINSTFGGNLVDLVRYARVLEVMDEEDLLANATSVGAQLLESLRTIEGNFEAVSNSRGRGFWAALDLPSTELRNQVVRAAAEERLMVLPTGLVGIRMRPTLTMSASEAQQVTDRLHTAIQKVL